MQRLRRPGGYRRSRVRERHRYVCVYAPPGAPDLRGGLGERKVTTQTRQPRCIG